MDRRSFFSLGLKSGVLLTLSCQNQKSQNLAPEFDYLKISPIDYLAGKKKQKHFSGDNPTYAHRILWNKEDWVKRSQLVPIDSHHRIVIVGGGMSGLLSSYFLKEFNPLILEQASRLGGNSKGESWDGIEYSLGAAYFSYPQKDSEIYQFLKELKLLNKLSIKTDRDDFFLLNKNFYAFTNDHEAGKQFLKLAEHLKMIWQNSNLKYPEIPTRIEEEKKNLDEYDHYSFYEFVRKLLGPLKNEVHAFIEHYSWSTFSASSHEISAAVVVNSLAAEFGEIAVFPGGNSAITEALAQDIVHRNENLIRTNSLVYDIQYQNDRYIISYMDDHKDIQRISADKIILSCPKFIASKMIELPEEKNKIIKKVKYRPYLVGNLLLNESLKQKFYALLLLNDGNVKKNNIEESARLHLATDVINATFTDFADGKSVLTFYRGIPFDGYRAEMLEDGAYDKLKREFNEQIQEVLNLLQINPKAVHEFRLTRWGHPMPIIEKGFFANREYEILNSPIDHNIYFIDQDNWMCPVFEVCFGEAKYWSEKIKASLLNRTS